MSSRHSCLLFGVLPLVLLLSACSAGFNSAPYDSSDPAKTKQRGVTYKLPRTVITYGVKYTLYRLTDAAGKVSYDAWVDAGDDAATAPVVLTPKVVGDEMAVFVIPTDDLAGFSVHTKKSEFSLSEDGVLTAVNAEFEDKSADIIKNFVSAGIKIGQTAVNPAVAAFLKGRTAEDGEAKEPKIEKVVTVTTTGEIDYAGLLRGCQSAGHLRFTVPNSVVVNQFRKLSFGSPLTVPYVTICFHPQAVHPALTTYAAHTSLRSTRAVSKPTKFKGIWMRQPVSVPVTVLAEGNTLLTTHVKIADEGPTTLVPVKSRAFTNRTTNVTVHGTTGSVSKHEFAGTSQGEKIALTTNEVVTELEKALPGILEKASANRAANAKGEAPTAVEDAVQKANGRAAEATFMNIEEIDRELVRLSAKESKQDKQKTKLTLEIDDAEAPVEKWRDLITQAAKEEATAADDLAKATGTGPLKAATEKLSAVQQKLGQLKSAAEPAQRSLQELERALQSVNEELIEISAEKERLKEEKKALNEKVTRQVINDHLRQ
jgi:hypothetical protein